MRLYEIELSQPDHPGTWLYRWNVVAETVEAAANKASKRASTRNFYEVIVSKVIDKGEVIM